MQYAYNSIIQKIMISKKGNNEKIVIIVIRK